jgi:hypothetical protein
MPAAFERLQEGGIGGEGASAGGTRSAAVAGAIEAAGLAG